MIAADAISSHSIFVTNNLADFSGIPGLSMENWVVYGFAAFPSRLRSESNG
jgi:hypothetical protein